MKKLIDKLTEGKVICINNVKYEVKTKTWYSIEEDSNTRYVKCELSNDKVLVIIPDDNLIYLGWIVKNMDYKKISKTQIEYNGVTYNKTGDGHQYIVSIEFGNEEVVEGKCIFEDYEYENNVISLGYLTDKQIRADVYANIIDKKNITILN